MDSLKRPTSRHRRSDVIAHDVGTWIVHADAVNYPADVRRPALTASNIRRVTTFASAGIPSEAVNLKSRQYAFDRLNDLPEMLIQGRERAYLSWVFSTNSFRTYAIDSAALEEYTRQYSAPGAMRAGFAWYRANFAAEGLAQAKARGQAIDGARLGARRIRRGGRRAARDGCYHRRLRPGGLDHGRDDGLRPFSPRGMP